ncbi:MAG TPA: hypothetical protein VN928_01050 [Myxococcales bacterium]|nr:hypothetical protein [Myxococcales bacterium]
MLHVANGDHSLSILRAAGLPGNVIAWSDVLDQGPLRGEPATPELRLARARWLEENGAGTLSEVNAQLEAWDAALQAPAEERVLWFEADLTCQLALLHHLVLVDASAVVTQEPVPEQRDFAALLAGRRRYDRGQARKAWAAVSSPDPRALESLDLSGLPAQMGPALRRLIEELPERGSGLSRTERAVLEEEGSFPRVQTRESVPWITDLFFARVVTELYEAGLFDEPARTECLDGRLDYRARAKDRWVGGVLLHGPSCFRRDGSRIIPPG